MAGLAESLRALAAASRGERKVSAAVRRSLSVLLGEVAAALKAAGYDLSVIDDRLPGWRRSLDVDVGPSIIDVFTTAWARTARGDVVDARPYATRHLESVWNRLVGVSDEVFDAMRVTLEEGRTAGEGIPELAARVDGLLADDQRWTNRARVVARTEVNGASNAGGYDAAQATADALGVPYADVAKEWLATRDSRTRDTHTKANGDQVMGLRTRFTVGRGSLLYACEPGGRAEEVIQCRCTTLYLMPGDPGYPAGVTTPPVAASAMSGTDLAAALTAAAEDGPTHAGIAVQAADTGRVLMIQRALWQDDPPDVAGTWEFPGGSIEEGETPEAAAWRGFTEETGLPTPDGETTGGWRGTDGIYQGLVFTVPVEAEAFPAGINPDAEAAVEVDPDNPERREPDVQAWFTLEQIDDLGTALRPAVRDNTDWSQFQPAQEDQMPDTVETAPEEDVAAGVLAAFARHMAKAGQPYDEALAALQATYASTFAPDDEEDPAMVPPVDGEEDDPADDEAPVEEEAGNKFYGIAAPEDLMSGDGREFGSGSLTWRDLPLPFMFQDAQAPGHDGAVRVGRLDTLERDSTTYPVPVIRYSGTWDISDNAVEAQRQVDDGVARGVSVDCDELTVELRNEAGEPVDLMNDEIGWDEKISEHATEARIAGLTGCSIPAFQQAYIANGVYDPATAVEPGWTDHVADPNTAPEEGAVAASAWSLTAAVAQRIVQPAAAFTNPGLTEETPLTVTDDGRVYGHLAVWGTCHIGIEGVCTEAPPSPTNYAYYATGTVNLDDGSRAAVGPLTMSTGHADLNLGWRPAAEHYDNTGAVVADVAMGQDGVGIWFAGMIRPGTTPKQIYALQAAGKVSGDWRTVGAGLDLVAALVVNTPGFPIPAAAIAASAAAGCESMVAAGMVTVAPARPLTDERAILRAVVATLTRINRRDAATKRLAQSRVADRARRRDASLARIKRMG